MAKRGPKRQPPFYFTLITRWPDHPILCVSLIAHVTMTFLGTRLDAYRLRMGFARI